MTRAQILAAAEIKGLRTVSENTVVIEHISGGCRPATLLEQRLLRFLFANAKD